MDYDQDDYNDQQPVYQQDSYMVDQSESINVLPSKSNKKTYAIYCMQNLMSKINKEVEELSSILGISAEWTFQLYYQVGWKLDFCYKLLDQKQSFKKQLKHTLNNVKSLKGNELCKVCYSSMVLIQNVCGHRYCATCWESNCFQKLKQFQLFPYCLNQQCTFRISYELIKKIFEQNKYYQMKFNQIVCKTYAEKNRSVKICPGLNCNKVFSINSFEEQILQCTCGLKVCIYCGQILHQPADCLDYKNWIKIFNDATNKWIQIVSYKLCPYCKEPVQKNQGCNHITCRCKGEFCWICGKQWKSHGGYNCPYRQEFDRIEQIRKRKLADEKGYIQKFEQTKAKFQRSEDQLAAIKKIQVAEIRKQLEQKIQILNTSTLLIQELVQFMKMAVSYVGWGYVSIFFLRKPSDLLELQIKKIQGFNSKIDVFIREYIPQVLEKHKMDKISRQQAQKQFQIKRLEVVQVKSQGMKYLLKLLHKQ